MVEALVLRAVLLLSGALLGATVMWAYCDARMRKEKNRRSCQNCKHCDYIENNGRMIKCEEYAQGYFSGEPQYCSHFSPIQSCEDGQEETICSADCGQSK